MSEKMLRRQDDRLTELIDALLAAKAEYDFVATYEREQPGEATATLEACRQAVESYIEELRGAPAAQPCVWAADEAGVWDTACGHSFTFYDGGPTHNGQKFCPYCGGSLVEVPFDEASDEEDT